MHYDNDNMPLKDDLPAWDSVTRIRPSPDELMALLHLRHEGPRPPTLAQLGAATPLVIKGERWCGRDGRWRDCETFEQPKGSRRLGKQSKSPRPVQVERQQDVGAPWSRWSPVVADGAEFMAGRTMPAVGGRQIRFGAVEDAMIALLDASRMPVAANDNAPAPRRRRSRRGFARRPVAKAA
jgi:hypothetical protein